MNTLEINTLLEKHPHSRPVFKGVYARNRLPRLLNVPSEIRIQTIEWDTTGSLYIHRRQLTRGILRSNGTSTARIRWCQFHEQTLPSLDLQYRSSTRRMIYRVRTSLHCLPHSSMCRTYHDRRHQALRKSHWSDGYRTEMCVVTC